MSKQGNRYGNAKYANVGSWLRSENGQAAFKQSQKDGDKFSVHLSRKVAIKETLLKETCKL